ncbi:putative pyruvate phosphate dikinase regulatory protein [Nymphaea thermarum]|nr:putative pyruvate phosphate dikinase regulatory protein [Nymphaea thermarum]
MIVVSPRRSSVVVDLSPRSAATTFPSPRSPRSQLLFPLADPQNPRFLSLPCVPAQQDVTNPPDGEMEEPRRDWKSKGSPKLSKWSRARSIRYGRRTHRPSSPERADSSDPETPVAVADRPSPAAFASLLLQSDDEEEADVVSGGKAIYMVSDGTGWTAEYTVNTALGQFDHCLGNRTCAVQTHIFSGIEDEGQLLEVIKQAARVGALVLYTLADPNMAESANHACQLWGVQCANILAPTTAAIAAHLGVNPSGIPRGKAPLTKEYFRRIDAIEFTIKQDDGALPENLHRADIVLVGVSRTGKTPLSIYLAQKGYKVANVPVVMGVPLPQHLFEVDQDKIFGLTIKSSVLQSIRKAREKTLGFESDGSTNYSRMIHVREELDYCGRIFAQNPRWPVIEVTGKAIEETAAVVVRTYHDRKQKHSIPRISRRY